MSWENDERSSKCNVRVILQNDICACARARMCMFPQRNSSKLRLCVMNTNIDTYVRRDLTKYTPIFYKIALSKSTMPYKNY